MESANVSLENGPRLYTWATIEDEDRKGSLTNEAKDRNGQTKGGVVVRRRYQRMALRSS